MTDKELLELAAKAAGISLITISTFYKDDWINFWNPLTDDGNALHLAVRLKLDISINRGTIAATWYDEAISETHEIFEYFDFDTDSECLYAVRRAIVRAAAEIGRKM